jgi:hypothetical protein
MKKKKTEFLNYNWTTNPEAEETRTSMKIERTVLKCSWSLILNKLYKKSWSRNRHLKSLIHADDDDYDDDDVPYMFREVVIATVGRMMPSGNVLFAKRTLGGWMFGSLTQTGWDRFRWRPLRLAGGIILAEGLHDWGIGGPCPF